MNRCQPALRLADVAGCGFGMLRDKDAGGQRRAPLRQIEERRYVRELNDGGYAYVVRYGMALFGKDCAAQMKV